MKTLVIAIASFIACVSANAQSSTVYYAPVNAKMDVGIGFDTKLNQCIFSIIEESNEKVDFNFDIINRNGESVLLTAVNDGHVNVIPKDQTSNYYQCNYAISLPELMDIIVNSKENIIVINGIQVSSNALASALDNIKKELVPATPQRLHMPRMNRRNVPQFGFFAFNR